MQQAMLIQYGPQMHYGLRIRAEVDELAPDRRRASDVRAVLSKYEKGIAPMFRLADDHTSPDGVLPVLAEVQDFLTNNDVTEEYTVETSLVKNLDAICAILDGHLSVVFKHYRQYTNPQALLAMFMLVAEMTTLLPNKHGANIFVSRFLVFGL